jgi:hypothetical protein
MSHLALAVLLIGTFCLSAGCGQAQGEPSQSPCICGATNWSRVSVGSGRFSALMPAHPTSSVITNQTEAGPAVVSVLKSEVSRTVGFGLLYHRFPTNSLGVADRRMFARGLKGTLGSDGRLISEHIVSMGGYPGREWLIEKAQGQSIYTVRSYVVGDDLFQAISIMPRGGVCQRHVVMFLDSCQLKRR